MNLAGPIRCLPSAAALLALCAAAGCSMADSERISVEPHAANQAMAYAGGTPCSSRLGSYALPKAFLHIQIGQKDDKTPPEIMPVTVNGQPSPVEVVRHPDNSLVFCLDYLASPFADEKVQVIKWSSDPAGADNKKGSFLGAVLVNVTDQTSFIVRALIRTLFIAETGAPGFAPRAGNLTPAQVVADLEIDPFNQRDMAVANARLSKLGYCLVLHHLGFPADTNIQHYCSAPLVHGMRPNAVNKAYAEAEATPVNPHTHGIIYRPREPYRLMIFHKTDPGGHRPWRLTTMMNVELENFSPVLSLALDRTVFAGKNISFIFQEGTLKTACISKGSELLGFADIPLEIVRSIVSVPASIAAVRIDQIGSKQRLIAAETQLYHAQQIYLQKLAGARVDQLTNLPASARDFTSITKDNFAIPTDLGTGLAARPFLDSLGCKGPTT